jgi:hypothetical protein
MISAYLENRLAPEALASFECRMLDEPLLLDQVQLEQAMRDGMRSAPWTSATQVLAQAVATIPSPAARRDWTWLGLAAGFVAGAIVPGALLVETRGALQQAQVDARSWEANPARVLLELTRGAPEKRTWLVARDARRLLIELPVARALADSEFRLGIANERVASVPATMDGLRPDADGIVSVLLPAATLPDGAYRIVVESRRDGAWRPYGEFDVELRRL